jgi:glycerol-3-phosphate dehydrogenase
MALERGERPPVAVIGGGVVGCAVAHALARRGVPATVLEAEPGLALGTSGANSGILHTGFDSVPGELETRLILRAAELRETLLGELGVTVLRCGALLRPRDEAEREAVARLAENAGRNGVEAELLADGSLLVPGETITNPVIYTFALAAAARSGGATVRLNAEVLELAAESEGVSLTLAGGERLRACAAVNCAGLHADEVAGLAGERPFEIYPRKGEFLVFSSPAPLARILLPVPSERGKGVLVFPALDGHVIAGPTARDRVDKDDWSVEADAERLIRERAVRMYPPLAGAQPVERYAGLRPAGRAVNYAIERSRTLPGLVHVAAIRSTGLSASLGIGEHVARLLAEDGRVELGEERALSPAETVASAASGGGARPGSRWWTRAVRHHAWSG